MPLTVRKSVHKVCLEFGSQKKGDEENFRTSRPEPRMDLERGEDQLGVSGSRVVIPVEVARDSERMEDSSMGRWWSGRKRLR